MLAQAIDAQAQKRQAPPCVPDSQPGVQQNTPPQCTSACTHAQQRILLEVNIGREAQKGGCLPEALPALLAACRQLPGLIVDGLMTIPPFGLPEEALRAHFREMRMLFEGIGDLSVLSMGMSADYAIAIQEGATMVRVGQALA